LVVAHLSATVPSAGAHLLAPSSHLAAVPWADTHAASSRHRTHGDKGPRPDRDGPTPLIRCSRHCCLCQAPSSRHLKPKGVLPIDSRSCQRFTAHHRVLTPSPSAASSVSTVVRRHHWCHHRLQSKPELLASPSRT
jgi:hypothetical protein